MVWTQSSQSSYHSDTRSSFCISCSEGVLNQAGGSGNYTRQAFWWWETTWCVLCHSSLLGADPMKRWKKHLQCIFHYFLISIVKTEFISFVHKNRFPDFPHVLEPELGKNSRPTGPCPSINDDPLHKICGFQCFFPRELVEHAQRSCLLKGGIYFHLNHSLVPPKTRNL